MQAYCQSWTKTMKNESMKLNQSQDSSLQSSFTSNLNSECDHSNIPRILITGGPGAGKTESKRFLQEALNVRGYHALFIPETATELIGAGISASTVGSRSYQTEQLIKQILKEKAAMNKAKALISQNSSTRPVLIFDRGTLDGIAWSGQEEFDAILQSQKLNMAELVLDYDAIFHMESAGCRLDENYDQSNNPARIASPKEACRLDHILRNVYRSNPEWHFIESDADIQKKMSNLSTQILAFLEQRFSS